jgi:hypothetical protein
MLAYATCDWRCPSTNPPPEDFTFVCPTEIIAFSDRAKEFEAINCQVGLSVHRPNSSGDEGKRKCNGQVVRQSGRWHITPRSIISEPAS